MENGTKFVLFFYLSGNFSVIKCLLGEVDILYVHVRDSEGLKGTGWVVTLYCALGFGCTMTENMLPGGSYHSCLSKTRTLVACGGGCLKFSKKVLCWLGLFRSEVTPILATCHVDKSCDDRCYKIATVLLYSTLTHPLPSCPVFIVWEWEPFTSSQPQQGRVHPGRVYHGVTKKLTIHSSLKLDYLKKTHTSISRTC